MGTYYVLAVVDHGCDGAPGSHSAFRLVVVAVETPGTPAASMVVVRKMPALKEGFRLGIRAWRGVVCVDGDWNYGCLPHGGTDRRANLFRSMYSVHPSRVGVSGLSTLHNYPEEIEKSIFGLDECDDGDVDEQGNKPASDRYLREERCLRAPPPPLRPELLCHTGLDSLVINNMCGNMLLWERHLIQLFCNSLGRHRLGLYMAS